ncbi:MAG: hypothetical protein Q8K63_06500 [Acidimicrobiales bacterium]|nr:hypothetical protein [Acidimicrobiales bacterium]
MATTTKTVTESAIVEVRTNENNGDKYIVFEVTYEDESTERFTYATSGLPS